MNAMDEELLKRLKETFRVEAEEHIRSLTSGLIALEKTPISEVNSLLIEAILRDAHSLKGAARSVNVKEVESICQVLESIFGKIKYEGMSLTAIQYDLIHLAIDDIAQIVSGSRTKNPKEVRELITELRSVTEAAPLDKTDEEFSKVVELSSHETHGIVSDIKEPQAVTEILSAEKPAHIETVRIQTAKLDPLFLQAEEMVQTKNAAIQRTTELKQITDYIAVWKTELRTLELRNTNGTPLQCKEILDLAKGKLRELDINIAAVAQAVENDQRILSRMIDRHLESMKSVLMLPVSTITEGFPIFVRDIARSQGKEVNLTIEGKEIEVDKRVLEELKDPLVHLLRNCIDHGIQKPAEREGLKKPPYGEIALLFSAMEGRQLEVAIFDDGSGIDLDKVRTAVIKSGVHTKETLEHLSTPDTLKLIYQSGITTSQIITDISGRGLGLAIVREKVEKLGGSISVESKANYGTTFRIKLPLTLSTFKGVLVRVGEHLFIVPTISIKRAARVPHDEIKTVENNETVMIDGKIFSAVYLRKVLGIANANNETLANKNDALVPPNVAQLLVLVSADQQIAFIVDEILDEYQILVKDMGKQLSRVRNISGAAVLGSGKVVPVINVSDLLKSASRIEIAVQESKETGVVKKQKVLVIDDSITSRTLIKNIVESAGYIVDTAVDGIDAYTKIFVNEYDIIISDVDMPRMNGFELTAKIRKDKKLTDLPVVLVTALESRDDRERGIDAGANAYIVKSSFDQSNLLEVINKLI